MFCYIWEFLVEGKHAVQFEAAYGPEGEWVRLFRSDPSYLRTLLVKDKDNPEHFLTLDFWLTQHAYLAFRDRHKTEFDALDARFAAWTSEERFVGDFDLTDPQA